MLDHFLSYKYIIVINIVEPQRQLEGNYSERMYVFLLMETTELSAKTTMYNPAITVPTFKVITYYTVVRNADLHRNMYLLYTKTRTTLVSEVVGELST